MPENQAPPLGDGFALSAIRAKARNYRWAAFCACYPFSSLEKDLMQQYHSCRRAGTDVGEILQASQRLAHAQSERQATACRLLPPVHWALLYTIGSLFVSTFILFETGGSFSNEGRHILFTVLCGLMSFVLCVRFLHNVCLLLISDEDFLISVLQALRDLADPAEGVYNATALLEERLSYVKVMLDKYQKLPARIPGPPQAATTGTAISLGEDAPRDNLLNTVITTIKNATGDKERESEEAGRQSQEPEPTVVMVLLDLLFTSIVCHILQQKSQQLGQGECNQVYWLSGGGAEGGQDGLRQGNAVCHAQGGDSAEWSGAAAGGRCIDERGFNQEPSCW